MTEMLDEIKARYLDRDIISKLGGNELAAVFRADAGWLLSRLMALRGEVIEEVAGRYHGALADFFDQKGYGEQLAGLAEKDHGRAKVHRTYAEEIRAQVWLERAGEESIVSDELGCEKL